MSYLEIIQPGIAKVFAIPCKVCGRSEPSTSSANRSIALQKPTLSFPISFLGIRKGCAYANFKRHWCGTYFA